MEAIFDAPMCAARVENSLGGIPGKRTDETARLDGGFALHGALGFDHGEASEAGPVVCVFEPLHIRRGETATDFESAVAFVSQLARVHVLVGEAAFSVGKEILAQLVVKRGLIIFDGQ